MSLSFSQAYHAHEVHTRDFDSRITPNATQRMTLIVAGCLLYHHCDTLVRASPAHYPK
ncbi:hypothetical protein BC834DRAFT_894295 [Gloeopeniophorella convolvens]|nr:hypothetical protein BC834DRAFT_894295 [Gloeopeniophorella convolvens]